MRSPVQIALLALMLSGPVALSCRPPEAPPPGDGPAQGLQGVARLVGMTDHAGTTVSLGDTGLETTTTSEGAFSFPEAQAGIPYTLRLRNGDFEETVPSVFLEDGITKILDGSLQPLPPFEVPRAHRLLTTQSARVVAVSADGSNALIISSVQGPSGAGSGLLRLPLAGGEPTVLWAPIDAGSLLRSPDGKTLFFSDPADVLLATSIDAGAARVVARGTRAYWIQFSPDGRSVLVPTRTGIDTCAWTLRLAPIEGGAEVALADNACFATSRFGLGNIPFWFSRTGERVLYFTPENAYTLRSVRVDGSATATVGRGVRIHSVEQSPDGSRVSYIGSDPPSEVGPMYLAAIDGSASVLLGSGANVPHFSSTGAHVFFVEVTGKTPSYYTGTLFLARADGSGRVELGQGVPDSRISFSPDGSHLIFFTQFNGGTGTLHLASVAGGPTTVLGSQVNYAPLTFSPDAQRLLFLSDFDNARLTGTLRMVSMTDHSVATIVSENPVYGSRFSPDSTQVLFIRSVNGSLETGSLGMYSVASGSSIQLGTGVEISRTFFTPDGTKLFFFSDFSNTAWRGTLQVTSATGGGVTPIATGVWGHVIFSPDGAHALFYTDPNPAYGTWTLQRVPSSGGPARPVASNTLAGDRLTFSPDGTRLIASSPDYARNTWVTTVASLPEGTVLLAVDSAAHSAAFSPDGKQVSFRSNSGTLQLVPSSGGAPTAYLGAATGLTWLSPTSLLAIRSGPLPLTFQNGVYKVTLR